MDSFPLTLTPPVTLPSLLFLGPEFLFWVGAGQGRASWGLWSFFSARPLPNTESGQVPVRTQLCRHGEHTPSGGGGCCRGGVTIRWLAEVPPSRPRAASVQQCKKHGPFRKAEVVVALGH